MKGLLNKFKEMSTKGKIATIIGILFIIGIFGNSGEEKTLLKHHLLNKRKQLRKKKQIKKKLEKFYQ